jgi:hypothetical protein
MIIFKTFGTHTNDQSNMAHDWGLIITRNVLVYVHLINLINCGTYVNIHSSTIHFLENKSKYILQLWW